MKHAVTVFLFLLGVSPLVTAATDPPPLTEVEQRAVVESLIEVIANDYMDADRAEIVEGTLRRNLEEGVYASYQRRADLAARLSTDLVDVSGDLHFLVVHDPEWIQDQREKHDPDVAARLDQEEHQESALVNHGFRDLRILDGNIGYLNLTYFADPEHAHDTVAAAMTFLANADAMVIDLRFNYGGYLEMAQLLCSYFLSPTPSQLLFDYYDLEDGKRIERRQWVLPSVSGQRMLSQPLYVLTSDTSFSAAEWLAFLLGNIGRATVVGEKTAGGAHPVNRRALDDWLVVQIPTGEIKDGVLGKDFEGVGVAPDIAIVSSLALPTAHRAALQVLEDLHPDRKDTYDWFRPVIESRLASPRIDPTLLESLAGEYSGRTITIEDGTLYYRWRNRGPLKLVPLGPALMALEGVDVFRFRIQSEDGVVTGLERLFQDGTVRLHPKSAS